MSLSLRRPLALWIFALLLSNFPILAQLQQLQSQLPPGAVVTQTPGGGITVAFDAASTAEMTAEMGITLDDAPEAAETEQDGKKGGKKPKPKNPSILPKLQKTSFDRRPSAVLRAIEAGGPEELAGPEASSQKTNAKQEKPPAEGEGEEKKSDAKAAAAKPDPHAPLLRQLQYDVTIGNWQAVGSFLNKQLKEGDERKNGYQHLLSALQKQPTAKPPTPEQPTQPNQNNNVHPQFKEQQDLDLSAIFALANLSPVDLDDTLIKSLAMPLRKTINEGANPESFIAMLHKGGARLGGKKKAPKRAAAKLLLFAGQAEEAREFLPNRNAAKKASDWEALNLLAQFHLAKKPGKGGREVLLEEAWKLTQDVLLGEKVEDALHDEALGRALDLAGRVKEDLGITWLQDSFVKNPARGVEILTGLGASAANHRGERQWQNRLRKLELADKAVAAFLATAPEKAKEPDYQTILHHLSANWLHEAGHSERFDQTVSRGPRMEWDDYGNMYFANNNPQQQQQHNNGNMPNAIPSAKVLDVMPSEDWVAHVDPAHQHRFDIHAAQLHMKLKEEAEAFPFIQRASKRDAETGKMLADKFLSTWTENHDPNVEKRRTNPYMYSYGYNPRAEGIPLTRSKQERHLKELAGWVKKLRALPIEESVDQSLLANAFTTCHSAAEVYKIEAIESVFGDISKLDPDVLGNIVQTMRGNLANQWRKKKTQQTAKTQRTDPEMLAEVARGYGVATEILARGRKGNPDHYLLAVAHAALLFDQNNFHSEQGDTSGSADRRSVAFDAFATAAENYAAGLAELKENEQSSTVYDLWFYASLGASDLSALKAEHQPSPNQLPLIRAAIDTLPKEASERHLSMFANALSTRMGNVGPDLKQRYLRHGVEIAGEHERAADAKKLFEYYDDLVSEIELAAYLDGSDVVGTDPFAVYIDIRHTNSVERESGGFGKYLQNQNNMGYGYNYGRPSENYRDKFEEMARTALSDSFEVISVTFYSHKIQAIGDPEDGWKRTPYCCILLKAKGSEIDTIPGLQMDLDFLDTSGYVVLPIASRKIPIDADTPQVPRPFSQLNLTQTLDEREASKGILKLEMRANAHGLVPPLSKLIALDFPGFTLEETDDSGSSVIELDVESDDQALVSERNITLTLRATEEEAPNAFAFPEPLVETADLAYQRYDDADLQSVEREISLEEEYIETKPAWMKAVIGLVALLLGLGVFCFLVARYAPTPQAKVARYQMPEDINPFTVLGLLQRISQEPSLGDDQRQELDEEIARLQNQFYGEAADATAENAQDDLHKTADTWIQRAA